MGTFIKPGQQYFFCLLCYLSIGSRFYFLLEGSHAVSPEHGLHLVGERRDHVPRDEEGGHVEEVEEDLVAVAQGGA